MPGEHGIVPVLDRLRLDRLKPAGRGRAAEDVVVPGEVAGVVLADSERGFRERLRAVAAAGERRIDADPGRLRLAPWRRRVEPDAILHDRTAELAGRLIAVVDVVRELFARRVVADPLRRNPVQAFDAVKLIAARFEHDVHDAALEVRVLGRDADRLHLDFLHHVGAREIPDAAVGHRGNFHALVLERVLIAARSEDDEPRIVRHLVDLDRRRVRDDVEVRLARRRHALQPVLVEVARHAGVKRVDDRRFAGDGD